MPAELLIPPAALDSTLRLVRESLEEWSRIANELSALAARQVALISDNGDVAAMRALLEQKETAYLKAQSTAERTLELEASLPDSLLAPNSEWKRLFDQMKDEVRAHLTALEACEARSREMIAQRLQETRAELETLGRGRANLHSYGKAYGQASGAAPYTPRFLDERR